MSRQMERQIDRQTGKHTDGYFDIQIETPIIISIDRQLREEVQRGGIESQCRWSARVTTIDKREF